MVRGAVVGECDADPGVAAELAVVPVAPADEVAVADFVDAAFAEPLDSGRV
jgi:hypothetical protein